MATEHNTTPAGGGKAYLTDDEFNGFVSRLRSLVMTARLVNGMVEEIASDTATRHSAFVSSEFLLVEIEGEINAIEQKLIDRAHEVNHG